MEGMAFRMVSTGFGIMLSSHRTEMMQDLWSATASKALQLSLVHSVEAHDKLCLFDICKHSESNQEAVGFEERYGIKSISAVVGAVRGTFSS